MGSRQVFLFTTLALTGLALMGPPRALASQSAPAKTLESLELKLSADEVQAVVEADGQMEHRVYLLEEPPQIVLDVLRVRNSLKGQTPKKPHPLLKRVRCQELPMTAYVPGERDGTFGRLIFDLKGPAQYWIRGEAGVLILGIVPREATGGNHESDDDGETEGESPAESGAPAEPTESGHPSNYEIEPEEVDPEVFFGREPLDSAHYRIGPEDVLEIRVFELEQLNRTVRVHADGNIDLPLIGLVPVGGLTSTQAAEEVAGKLRNRFVQNPQVSVLIMEFNSRKVSLLGSVNRPATYPLVGRRNLLQIIADAGGLSGEAGGILYVFRPLPDGKSARLSVPLNELLIKGDPRWNIWLMAGDIVSIPPEEAITVSVLGAVRNPGLYKLPVGEDASLLRAIALAGGLTERGSKSGIQVKRRTGASKETVIKVDLGKILSGEKPDVFLEEGDVILVKESFF